MTLLKAFSFDCGYFSDHFWTILDPKPQSWSLDQTRPDQTRPDQTREYAGSKNLYFPRDQSAKTAQKWIQTVLGISSSFYCVKSTVFEFFLIYQMMHKWASNDCKLYLLGQGLDVGPIRVLNDASYHIH